MVKLLKHFSVDIYIDSTPLHPKKSEAIIFFLNLCFKMVNQFSKKDTAAQGKSRNVPKLGTESIVRLDGGRTSLRLPANRSQKSEPMDLARENQALHERLREEAARYDRRLDTYKLAQQRQAVLVSRLQAKVNFSVA